MPNFKDHLQLHFIVLIWGFTAILGLLISLPAVELVFYRTLIAAVLLFFLIYGRRLSLKVSRREGLKILATGGLIGLHWILFFASSKVSTASVCLAGMTTASLWTALLEPLFYRRKLSRLEMGLALVIIFGLYIIFRFEFNHLLGLLMAIASAFFGALFTVINAQLVRKHHHYVITFYEMAGATLSIVLFFPAYALYFSSSQSLNLLPSPQDWFYILLLAGVCTVYAYSASVKLMHKFTAYAINLTVNLEPVYGIVLAFLIFGEKEKMTFGFYLGTFIILLAVLSYPTLNRYANRRRARRQKQALIAAEAK